MTEVEHAERFEGHPGRDNANSRQLTGSTPSTDIGGDPPCWAHLLEDPVILVSGELARIETLVDPGDAALIACDSDGRFILWSDAAGIMLGWSANEIIGESVEIIIPTRSRRVFWDTYFGMLRSSTAVGSTTALNFETLMQLTVVDRDGQEVDVSLRVHVLRGTGPFPTRIAGVISR